MTKKKNLMVEGYEEKGMKLIFVCIKKKKKAGGKIQEVSTKKREVCM